MSCMPSPCNMPPGHYSPCHLYCRHLEYEDAWALFGEGRHPHARRLFETCLAPFMSQTAITFWQDRMWYFDQGLYYQGGMVSWE